MVNYTKKIKKTKNTKRSKKRSLNPNMRTKAWGGPAWFYITCSLLGYPETRPTKTQRNTYKRFLVLAGKTLPCNLCRVSYAKFVKELPMTPKVLSSRKNLVMWFFKIHNKVNKKLGCKQLTSAGMEKKYKWYNKFRAMSCSPTLGGCVKALSSVKKPKKTKIVMCVDKQAMRLKKSDKKNKNKN